MKALNLVSPEAYAYHIRCLLRYGTSTLKIVHTEEEEEGGVVSNVPINEAVVSPAPKQGDT